MEMVHFIPPSQLRVAMLAAQADGAAVLICGSSGSGKGAIATWIHKNGPRAAQRLLNASRDKPLADQILEAQGGSLLIPEIGEWPLGAQRILLDYLNTRTIPHPSGAEMPMLANARVIATTSQTLEARARAGLFNGELLRKLNVFRIEMPDLSRRVSEFEDIAQGVLHEITHEIHKEHIRAIATPAMDRLKKYHWPGNIRELRNVLRMAVLSSKNESIELQNLPADFEEERIDFQATREEFEKIYLTELLKTFDWQIDKTCHASRLSRQVLMDKIKRYGIDLTSNGPSLL